MVNKSPIEKMIQVEDGLHILNHQKGPAYVINTVVSANIDYCQIDKIKPFVWSNTSFDEGTLGINGSSC